MWLNQQAGDRPGRHTCLQHTGVNQIVCLFEGFSGAVDRSFVFFVLKTFLVSAGTREAHCFYLDGILIWGGR